MQVHGAQLCGLFSTYSYASCDKKQLVQSIALLKESILGFWRNFRALSENKRAMYNVFGQFFFSTGIGGTEADAPVAITAAANFNCCPFTSIVFLLTKIAWPW